MGVLAGFGDVSLTIGQWSLNQQIRVTGVDSLGTPFDESVQRDLDMSWVAVDWTHPWVATDLIESDGVKWTVDLRSAVGAGMVGGLAEAVATPSVSGVAKDVEDRAPVATVGAVMKSEIQLGKGWSVDCSARYFTGLGSGAIDLQQMAMFDVGVELRW